VFALRAVSERLVLCLMSLRLRLGLRQRLSECRLAEGQQRHTADSHHHPHGTHERIPESEIVFGARRRAAERRG